MNKSLKSNSNLNVKEVLNHFKLKIYNQEILQNPDFKYGFILAPAISRAGIEITTFQDHSRLYKNVIGWGTSESLYFESLPEKKAQKAIEYILKLRPPLLLLSKGVSQKNIKLICKIANKFLVPVVVSKWNLSLLTVYIGTFISNFFGSKVQIHGSLVFVNSVGILIIGKSGIGKSEAVLDLIQKNHYFVADDAVIIKQVGDDFYGSSNFIVQDLLEVRGIGLINVKYTYGAKSLRKEIKIDLVCELVDAQKNLPKIDRLGFDYLSFPILDGQIRKIQIPVLKGRTISTLIEAAANVFLASQDKQDIISQIQERTNW